MTKSIKLTIKLSLIVLTNILFSCGDNTKETHIQTEAKEHLTSKTYEMLFADFVPILEELSAAIMKINDLETAKANMADLNNINKKLNIVRTDMLKLEEPSEETQSKVNEVYGERIKRSMMRIKYTMTKLKTDNSEAYQMINKLMTPIKN